MNKITVLVSSFILTSSMSLAVQADTTQTTGASVPTSPTSGNGTQTTPATSTPMIGAPAQSAPNPKPCHAIKAACKKAGYYIGGDTIGKGLKENCAKPLLLGQSVPGVTVNPADIQACLALHPIH